MESKFAKEWESIIKEDTLPRKMRNVRKWEYDEFKNLVYSSSDDFVKDVVKSLYAGDIFILSNAYEKSFISDLKDKVYAWEQEEPSSFHKIYDGVPNFHRRVDKDLEGSYAMNSMWHQHFLFKWNDDKFGIVDEIYKRWRMMKVLSGFNEFEFENNIPSDGMVDRIHIYRYPRGGGYLEAHSDPYKYQKTIMCAKMSEKGKEYNEGGLYFYNEAGEKVNVEDSINIGDMYFSFPTLLHGVDPIDQELDIDWKSKGGRWFLGLYSIHSDHVKDRHTSFGAELVDGEVIKSR